MSPAEYNRRVLEQGGKCAICPATSAGKGNEKHVVRRFAIDHDHRTGRIRKLLCDRCNKVLGFVKDDAKLLRSMIEYLASEGEES